MSVRVVRAFLEAAERRELELLAEHVAWEPGRQGTGYEKCAIAAEPQAAAPIARALRELGAAIHGPYDVWLIRYQVGTEIPPHRDPVEPGREHHRLNAIVRSATGGDAKVRGVPVALAEGDAYVFRPDAEEHEVTRVTAGTRLVFSVGVLR